VAKLNLEARMTIKTLKDTSHAEVARLLGVSEGTVRYHRRRLAQAAVDGRSQQQQSAADLSDAIASWYRVHEDFGINLQHLHAWLVEEHGYAGSCRSVQRYVKRHYPAPRIRARRRVETPPGAQSQADWSEHPNMIVGGRRTPLYRFHLILSHSRGDATVWSTRKDQLSWHRCHTEAFVRLGGVSATVRVDNEKTAVVRGAGPWGVINKAYRRYAQLLRFHVDACLPRAPQTKGKVERNVRTHRMAADASRLAWRDLNELQAWTDERTLDLAHHRECPATGTNAFDAWQEERHLLTPLPDPMWEPFDLAQERRVGRDCLVAFENRQYSVPFRLLGQHVEVRGCAETVQVVHENQIVAVHPRRTTGRIVIDEAHYEGDNTDRVIAPMPMGRMGRRIMELAAEPVQYRSIELYHALAEVAR
jgi:transposase